MKFDFFLSAIRRMFGRLPVKVRIAVGVGLALLVVFAISPLLSFVFGIVKAVLGLFGPILADPVGRFVLVNAVLAVAAVLFVKRLKAPARRFFGDLAADRWRSGLLLKAMGDPRRAARRHRAAIRLARWGDPGSAAPAASDLAVDARIRLADCLRARGDRARAIRELAGIRGEEIAPELRKKLLEVRAFLYAESPDLVPETVEREIGAALAADPDNPRLLRLARDRAERAGDLDAAIDAQRRLARTRPAPERGAERTRLGLLHARHAVRRRREGKTEEALADVSKARASAPDHPLPALLAGDMEAEQGDVRSAVLAWARRPSRPGLDRIRGLVRAGRLRGDEDLEFVALAFPRAGILSVLAEAWRIAGRPERAEACLRKLEELGVEDPLSASLAAGLRRGRGDLAGARAKDWRALKGLLAGDAQKD